MANSVSLLTIRGSYITMNNTQSSFERYVKVLHKCFFKGD